MYEISVEHRFRASHYLRGYHGKDESPHEHDWRAEIRFRGKNLAQPEGYLLDFAEVQGLLKKIVSVMDGKSINGIRPFDKLNPSAENIARWVYTEFARLSAHKPARVTIWEKDGNSAGYIPDDPKN